jgi:hypothetical protein
MSNRGDILRNETHKGQTDTIAQRAYYTLRPTGGSDASDLQAHRNTRAIGYLLERLHKQGVLSDDAIDDILLKTAMDE